MGFKLNLTNDEIKQAQGGFAALPAGTYGAVVFSNTFKMSKATPPNPMFEIDFKITEGQAGIGRKQRGWFVLTGKGLFKIVELHKALGFDYPNPKTGAGEFEFPETDEYLGKEVNIVIDVEKYASVNDDGEDEERERNVLKYVRAYDADKISTGEDEAEDSSASKFTL